MFKIIILNHTHYNCMIMRGDNYCKCSATKIPGISYFHCVEPVILITLVRLIIFNNRGRRNIYRKNAEIRNKFKDNRITFKNLFILNKSETKKEEKS